MQCIEKIHFVLRTRGNRQLTVLAIAGLTTFLGVLLGLVTGLGFGISMCFLAFVNVSVIAFHENHYVVNNLFGIPFRFKYSDPLRMGMRRKNGFSFTVLKWKRVPFLFTVRRGDEELERALEQIEEANKRPDG